MHHNVLASRYAKALFEQMKEETERTKMLDFFDLLEKAFSIRDVLDFLRNPLITIKEKQIFLVQIVTISKDLKSDLIKAFLDLLLYGGRIHLLPSVGTSFRHLHWESLGQVQAQITFASQPTEQELNDAVAILEEKTGKKMIFHVTIDPKIFGGCLVSLGTKVLDLTLKTKALSLTKI